MFEIVKVTEDDRVYFIVRGNAVFIGPFNEFETYEEAKAAALKLRKRQEAKYEFIESV